MEINKTTQKNDEVVLTVLLNKEECNECYQFALNKVSQNFSQKGFRKGRVHSNLVERTAKPRLFFEYEECALRKIVSRALEKEKITPILRPEIKIIKSAPGQIFECQIKLVPYPDISLGKYKDLGLKRKKTEVEEKEVSKALEFLVQSRATFKQVAREAKEGDQLEISFDAFDANKKIEEGSSPHYPLRLGKSHLHPRFEKKLYGTKAGDEKTFSIKYDKAWPQEAFRDKKIDFKVRVKSVSETILPKLDDEFAKSLGNFKGLEEVKNSLREGLLQEKLSEETKKLQEEILQKIIADSKIKIPEILIEKEAKSLLTKLEENLSAQKITLKNYLERIKITRDQLNKDLKKQAEKQLKTALLINEIAKAEALFPQEQEIEEFINEQLKKLKNYHKNPEDIDLEKMRSYTFEYLTNQKVINWLTKTNICV